MQYKYIMVCLQQRIQSSITISFFLGSCVVFSIYSVAFTITNTTSIFFLIFSGLVLGFCVCKETVIDLHNIKTPKWVKTSFIPSIRYSITSFELSHKCHYLFVFVSLFACFFLFKNLENKSIISLTKVKYAIDFI